MHKDINTTIQGEHQLAKLILPVIPLIEKHFKPFDGHRAKIASGADSAPYAKICTAFRDAAQETNEAGYFFQVFVGGPSGMSAYVEFKTHIRDPRSDCGVIYFKHSVYIGQVNDGGEFGNGDLFKYEYKPEGTREYCDAVLATTEGHLSDVKQAVSDKVKELNTLKDSVLYTFKECIKDPYER